MTAPEEAGVPPDGESPPPTALADAPSPATDPLQPQQLVFDGTGSEYFRIWIVNLVLSVITLGIYSPWAKVRRLQYFYRNTRIAGASFDYHGSPIALLKGRIVAALMLGAYYAATAVSPIAALIAIAVFALALPWLIVRSLRFRCYNSSYRGIRFRFHGTTGEAYWVYLLLPVLSVFTFFLLLPYVFHQMRRYQQDNISYGTMRMTTTVPVSEFYISYVMAGFAFGALLMAAMVVMIVTTMILVAAAGGSTADEPPLLVMIPFLVVYAMGLLLSRAIVQARIQNAVWSSSWLGPHGFDCSLKVWRLFGLTLTNVAATLVTFGLFLPFAHVRLARYMASEFRLYPGGPLDAVERAPADPSNAVGEEAAEMFDVDIAF